MNKNGKWTPFKVIGTSAGVIILAVLAIMFYPQLSGVGERIIETEPKVGDGFEGYTEIGYQFDLKSIDSDAQDSEADLDIDCYKYTTEANTEANNKGYIDCSETTALEWDGSKSLSLKQELKTANLCKVSSDAFWNEFTAGNEEDSMDDAFEKVSNGQDLDPYSTNSSLTVKFASNSEYVCTVVDTSEKEDTIPFAFRIKTPEKTDFADTSITDATAKVRVNYNYYSDAYWHGKTRVDMECTDSDNGNVDLSNPKTLNGVVDSSYATATDLNWLKCDVILEITKDGYALEIENQLATAGNQDNGKLIIQPYGFNVTAGTNDGAGNESLANDPKSGSSVVYDTTAPINGILYASSEVCGVTLTTSSTDDAIKDANENLYADELTCLKSIKDENSQLVIPIEFNTLPVKYVTENNSDAYINTGEELADVSLFGILNETDLIGQTITG